MPHHCAGSPGGERKQSTASPGGAPPELPPSDSAHGDW
jgi:hypothetical protein